MIDAVIIKSHLRPDLYIEKTFRRKQTCGICIHIAGLRLNC